VRVRLSLVGAQQEFRIAQGPSFENVSKRKTKELSQSEAIDCAGELAAMLPRR